MPRHEFFLFCLGFILFGGSWMCGFMSLTKLASFQTFLQILLCTAFFLLSFWDYSDIMFCYYPTGAWGSVNFSFSFSLLFRPDIFSQTIFDITDHFLCHRHSAPEPILSVSRFWLWHSFSPKISIWFFFMFPYFAETFFPFILGTFAFTRWHIFTIAALSNNLNTCFILALVSVY